MTRFATLLLLAFGLTTAASAQSVTVSQDIAANATWTAANTYLLDGLIYVRPGATLTIEPGTVIKGKQTPSTATGDLASGIVVMVGAKIEANGTAEAPIIMTAESDDVTNPTDVDEFDRALWGGLIVLGRATTNSTPGINFIEGVPESDDTRFGCDATTAGFACNDDDDSGTLRYVSLRHGGFGFRPNSEINGMTFGAVGRGTTIEYVEVFANSDDAFEFFGGTTEVKYLAGSFSGDDTIDTDRGFRGKFQFAFSLNGPGQDAGRCFEADGGDSSLGGEDATPFSIPLYSNVTCIGAGIAADQGQLGGEGNSAALQLRDNTGGKIYNSIFTDFPGSALDLEALSSGEDTENRFGTNTEGTNDLVIRNNFFFGFGDGNSAAELVNDDSDNAAARQTAIETAFGSGNRLVDPQLAQVNGRTGGTALDPRPLASGPAATGAQFTGNALAGDAFFTTVDYYGAFAPTASAEDGSAQTWLAGWTVLAQNGYLSGRAVANDLGPVADGFALSVGPNPTRGDATVRFSLTEAQQVQVALYDVTGRRVAEVSGTYPAGPSAVSLPTAGLATGVYVVRFDGRDGRVSQTVSVVR